MAMSTARIRLKRVAARDFSLLRDVGVGLGPGLTVITGESGAGKTLLFDAIAFALGERPHRSLLAEGAARCEVVLELELDADTATQLGPPWQAGDNVLERRWTASGRSRLKLNGEAATVGQVQAVGQRLIEITGQFENRVLFNLASHLAILDAFGGDKLPRVLAAYRERYAEWRSVEERLRALSESAAKREQELDYLRFQVDELEKAGVQLGERTDVAARLKLAENAEALVAAADGGARLLDGDEDSPGAFDLAAQAGARIAELGQLLGGIETALVDPDELGEQAADLLEGLRELAGRCRTVAEAIQHDPAETERLRERLNELLRLERKYGCAADELPGRLKQWQERYALLTGESQSPEALEGQVAERERQVRKLALELTALRRKAAKQVVQGTAAYFRELGFTHVELHVELADAPDPGPDGADTVELLISLNPGEPARELTRVASGGEASRLLLGLKAALAGRLGFGVLLLDEIEAGLGGETAGKVAAVLSELARERQVLSITHLPVVAAQGDTHLAAWKEVKGGRSCVVIERLTGEARRAELTRMLGETGGAEEQALVDKLLAGS